MGPNNTHVSRKEFIIRKAASHKTRLVKKNRSSPKAFWVSTYDPRVLHPRKIISRNYHILENDPIAAQIFPRKNLVASSKRLKNLTELISPTVPSDLKPDPPRKKPDLPWGSFQCQKRKGGGSCDLCSHLSESNQVISFNNNRKFSIRKHLSHDVPDLWLIYLITDTFCSKQYIGSTYDMRLRFANHKSTCNKKASQATGLATHFSKAPGCPGYNSPNQSHLKVTLIDGIYAPKPELKKKGHKPNSKTCSCFFCQRLATLENQWICRMQLFQGPAGLNIREDFANIGNPRIKF